MSALADARPGGLNALVRPGTTVTVTLTWPADALDGRTFTSTLNGDALDLTVAGDVMTVVATDTITGELAVGQAYPWLLLEDIDGTDEPVMVGTWAADNGPRAITATSLTVSAGAVAVAVTVNSAQASLVAIDGRLEDLEATELVTWAPASAWGRFTEVPVNTIDNTIAFSADDGVGVATGVGGPSADDRRLYITNIDCADVEVHVDFETVGGSVGGGQFGVALRRDGGEAVVVWNNIIFGATGQVLQGVWEFDGDELHGTNQAEDHVPLWGAEIVEAVGDGTRVTVRTETPHLLQPGHLIALVDVGSFGNVAVANVIDDTTFTFTDSTAGSWSGGTWTWVIAPGRRKLAVRLVGDTISFTQWLPGQDPPNWDDPERVTTNTLPATLDHSGQPPPASGTVGFMLGHMGTGAQVRVADWRVTNLDRVNSPELVHPDRVTHTEVGEQTARVDVLDHRSAVNTPADHRLAGWAFDPVAGVAGGTVTVGGTVYLTKVPVRADRTVSTIYWGLSAAATTPTAGQNHVGIYTPAGSRIATADVTAGLGSTGLMATSITPVTIVDPWVWVAFVFNAATPPSIWRGTVIAGNGLLANVGLAAAERRHATNGAGQTSLPASITPSSNANTGLLAWAALA